MGAELEVKSLWIGEIKAPTCEMYEPNFEKVFEFAQDRDNIKGAEITDYSGQTIAGIWMNREIYEVKKWIKGASSNAARGNILVKNPARLSECVSGVGVRNGLIILHDTAFAVRIGSANMYITRPVVPELQEVFVRGYNRIVRSVIEKA